MSHETHHHSEPKIKQQAAGKPSFWFSIMLAGLFIAAVNFVNIMGHDEEGHGAAGHGTEEVHTTQDATHIEATPQDNIASDPAHQQTEKANVPHEENAPNKAPSEAEAH